LTGGSCREHGSVAVSECAAEKAPDREATGMGPYLDEVRSVDVRYWMWSGNIRVDCA